MFLIHKKEFNAAVDVSTQAVRRVQQVRPVPPFFADTGSRFHVHETPLLPPSLAYVCVCLLNHVRLTDARTHLSSIQRPYARVLRHGDPCAYDTRVDALTYS